MKNLNNNPKSKFCFKSEVLSTFKRNKIFVVSTKIDSRKSKFAKCKFIVKLDFTANLSKIESLLHTLKNIHYSVNKVCYREQNNIIVFYLDKRIEKLRSTRKPVKELVGVSLVSFQTRSVQPKDRIKIPKLQSTRFGDVLQVLSVGVNSLKVKLESSKRKFNLHKSMVSNSEVLILTN